MSSKSGISVKGSMDFKSVATFLDDLVRSFKDKTVVVQRGDEFVTLKPTDNIDLELEAVMKKGKQKLTLELAWREEAEIQEEVSFQVSSKEPEPKPQPTAEAEVSCATVCADTPEDAKKAMEAAAEATSKSTASKTGAKK